MNSKQKREMPEEHRKNIVQTIRRLSRRWDTQRVFSDFVELTAISISNVVDQSRSIAREARYLQIVSQYSPEEVGLFPKMVAELDLALAGGFDDVLGRVFCELKLQGKYAGQFLTPYELCRMVAKASVFGGIETITDRRYLRLVEPACGSGALIIAFAQELEAAGIQYEDALQVTAVDIDPRCTHMTYVQLALLGISGVVVHGNTLSVQEISVWVTPARIMNLQDRRLRRTEVTESTSTIRSTRPT